MFWSRARRREKVKARAFPEAWEKILAEFVPYYRYLPEGDRAELRGHVQVLVAEKNFEGCGGLAMTDEIKVTVAGYASILLLHREAAYYPRLSSILVYPDAFVARAKKPKSIVGRMDMMDAMDFVDEDDGAVRDGESWETGAIVLAWKPIVEASTDPASALNVALHEFAHQLDLDNGEMDGVPALESDAAHEEWVRVIGGEYDALCDEVDRGRETWLDAYGAEHPAEFFAVLTEAFFMRPHTLQRKHGDVYAVLREYYKQDPAAVLPKA
ncbi:MAG: zinc-dependent peptidase [Candidatus Hydrogenedentes bacterium]|nr:zinc-dependent peptidase [Candidatus Hydrogenedentota bacterium]